MRLSIIAILVYLCGLPMTAHAQPRTPADCLPVLTAKDYFQYAMQSHLHEDYLRTIDSQTWNELKTSNKVDFVGLFSGGAFSLSDDYSTFDSKRTKYFDSTKYTRTQQQALNILQITTSPRAYPAYEACLRTLAGSGIVAWAARESRDEIELHVRYANPAGVRSMRLEGHVTGGRVMGAPRNHLWRDPLRWGVNQEKTFIIKAEAGVPETNALITASDGSPSISLTFKRADATFAVEYVGTIDVLRQKGREESLRTPNNDHNTGACPNEVGRQDGKWCISRTKPTLRAAAPRFFRNAKTVCRGGACPWANPSTEGPATISPDGLTVTGSVDNWGSAVDAAVIADEYELVSSSQCGIAGPIPVIRNQAVSFAVSADCLPIATLKVSLLPVHSTTSMKFGDEKSADGSVVTESTVSPPGAVVISYKLVK